VPAVSEDVEVIGALDANFAWTGRALCTDAQLAGDVAALNLLRGAAGGVHRRTNGGWRLFRDPLGINKLFWVQDDRGRITVASRPKRLVERGWPFETIRSLPRGTVVDLQNGYIDEHSIIPGQWSVTDPAGGETTLKESGRVIRDALDGYLAALSQAHPTSSVFVCLSGGLDSSGIAALAHQHFPELVAVSFDMARPDGRGSEDRLTARRLAGDLGMPLLEATVSEDELFEALDVVLVEGIDWRDFNVHAALVNAALARTIDRVALRPAGTTPLVLTGDLANEFLVDYQPERYRDATYYALPRLSGPALRSALVRGLDTCHREIGVFAAWGLSAVQPYAAATDTYLALPAAFLARDDRKERLCREVLGDLLPEYIFTRPKARAQVGGPEVAGGVLAACVDRGFDSAWLWDRFVQLHGIADPHVLHRFIRGGCYRSGIPGRHGTRS